MAAKTYQEKLETVEKFLADDRPLQLRRLIFCCAQLDAPNRISSRPRRVEWLRQYANRGETRATRLAEVIERAYAEHPPVAGGGKKKAPEPAPVQPEPAPVQPEPTPAPEPAPTPEPGTPAPEIARPKIDITGLDSIFGEAVKTAIETSVTAALETVDTRLAELHKRLEEAQKNAVRIVRVQAPQGKVVEISEHTHPVFEEVVELAQLNFAEGNNEPFNILLKGPAGCGKTHLAKQLGKALGLRAGAISCSEGMSESEVSGYLLPIGENGQFKYVPAPFIDFYTNGGVYLIDEMDAADANVLVFLNSALANGEFTVPKSFESPVMKRHPKFICIAAANTWGSGPDAMFCGRNPLDESTKDRFEMVEMDFDTSFEEKVVAPEILAWGLQVRRVLMEKKIRRSMGTRKLVRMTQRYEGYKNGTGPQRERHSLTALKRKAMQDWTQQERDTVLAAIR